MLRLANGYYALVPEMVRGRRWKPAVESVGLAIAQADYSVDAAAIMGPSAARLLGNVPRGLGTATIAVTKQRPSLDTVAGRVRFVTRRVQGLDLQRTETELAAGWVTTPEQTLVDLIDRPTLGGFELADARAAIQSLAAVADLDLTLQLAETQHKSRTYDAIVLARETEDWTETVGLA